MNNDIATLESSPSDFDRDITLKPQKNADLCANCGAELGGQFCHSCGQSSKSMIKFFGEVIKELLDDTLGYDSRLKHSLFPLFFKPGRLTLDYIKGKRFHYVLPFKLYLITSVLFILLIKNTADTENLKFDDVVQNEVSEEISKEVEEEFNEVIEEVNKANAARGKKLINFQFDDPVDKETTELTTDPESDKDEELTEASDPDSEHQNHDRTISIGTGDDDIDLDWNDETEQLDGVENLKEGFLKTFFTKVNPKLKFWKNDPEPLVESIIETIPYIMFIILPFFAIFLKIFYAFSKRYYTEHLVFLLHNHSFIYMLMMVQIGLNFGGDNLSSMNHWSAQGTADGFEFISIILSFWMFIYVFLAMKRFYRQGWWATIFKTVTLGFIYLMMLAFGFVATVAFGAYQA